MTPLSGFTFRQSTVNYMVAIVTCVFMMHLRIDKIIQII